MKNKKIPLRSCVVTKEQLEKKDLFRIVKNKDGLVFIDETNKANGRGAYLKKDVDVIKKAKMTHALDRHLGVVVEDNIYEELIKMI